MATAVVSGRVDAEIKRRVDSIIREAGTSVGDVIKNTWEQIAATGELPQAQISEYERNRRQRAVERFRQVVESLPPCPNVASLTDDDIKELMTSRYV